MKILVHHHPLVFLLLLLIASTGSCQASFQLERLPLLPSCIRSRSATHCRVTTLCLSTTHQPMSDDDTVVDTSSSTAVAVTSCTRRAALFGWTRWSAAAALATVTTTTTFPAPVAAAAIVGGGAATQSAVRVASWPGIETLEPLYELKLSIDAITVDVKDANNWSAIQARLERFFQGFIVNEKNFYLGVAFQYSNDIQYAREELPAFILLDKESRYDAIESTMKSLESLKSSLAAAKDDDDAAANIAELAKAAQAALHSWFALVPVQDYQAVQELFVHVQKADTNPRDGRLSYDELIYLSPVEQQIWKRRVEKFG
jgi:hypothetical protein